MYVSTLLVVVALCIFAGLLLWTVVATALHFCNPIGIPDRGHRCFTLANEKARLATLEVLRPFGLREGMSFDPPPTKQTLLNDGRTVLMTIDGVQVDWAISVAVKSNKRHHKTACADAAELAAAVYRRAGFSPKVDYAMMPELGHQGVVLVLNDVAVGRGAILFRLHARKLGMPPNLHWKTRGLLQDLGNSAFML